MDTRDEAPTPISIPKAWRKIRIGKVRASPVIANSLTP
jgi:hypothetical protein